jgi:hypothetical protein
MICEQCGKLVDSGQPKQRFCSRACDSRWRYLHPKFSLATCKQCGGTFIPKAKDRTQFCSRECGFQGQDRVLSNTAFEKRREDSSSRKDARWVHWYFGYCAVCGLLFTKGQNKVTCGGDCAQGYTHRHVLPTERSCIECGALFMGQADGMYCSAKCTRRVHRRARKVLRKMKYAETEGMCERVTFRAVWEHSSRCHVCGGLCSLQYVGVHPLAPTIDHVVPISRGGMHLNSNAAIAHMICNCFKGIQPVTPKLIERCQAAVKDCKVGLDGWRWHPLKVVGRVNSLARQTA